MSIDYDKLIRREVSRKVSREHPFYDDLCQEARIAVFLADQKLDKTLPLQKQTAFVKNAIRWRIVRAWREWLSDSALVSDKSLREHNAVFDKVTALNEFVEETVSDGRVSPEEEAADKLFLETVLTAIEDVVKKPEEHAAAKALLDDTDSRTLGTQIGKSHQGALNIQKRLIEKIRKRVLRGRRKFDSGL